MSYMTEIAGVLTKTLERFATLNSHQLAGQSANLDFWAAEVRHSLEVIDAYRGRFEKMKEAQQQHMAKFHTTEWTGVDPDPLGVVPQAPRPVSDVQIKEARRYLCDAFYRFTVRCYNESLIGEAALNQILNSLEISIDIADLKRQ